MRILKRYLQHASPSVMIDEAALFLETRFKEPTLTWDDLTPARLADLSAQYGTDFTTALLFDRLRESTRHKPFISGLEATPVNVDAPPKIAGRLLLVPAGFYRDFPNFGGGGEVILQIGRRHGLACELAPTDSTGRMVDNAEVMLKVLREADAHSLFLFTLSRGASEVRLALSKEPELIKKIRKWVMVCGTLFGSRQADHMLALKHWKKWLIYRALGPYGFTPEIVAEFRTGPEGILPRPWEIELPKGLLTCIVPCCLRSHLNTGGQRRRYDQLKKYGPNDGIMLFSDSIYDQAEIYPVWGADHYMRVPGTAFLFYRLFGYFAAEAERVSKPEISFSNSGSRGTGADSVAGLGPNHILR